MSQHTKGSNEQHPSQQSRTSRDKLVPYPTGAQRDMGNQEPIIQSESPGRTRHPTPQRGRNGPPEPPLTANKRAKATKTEVWSSNRSMGTQTEAQIPNWSLEPKLKFTEQGLKQWAETAEKDVFVPNRSMEWKHIVCNQKIRRHRSRSSYHACMRPISCYEETLRYRIAGNQKVTNQEARTSTAPQATP